MSPQEGTNVKVCIRVRPFIKEDQDKAGSSGGSPRGPQLCIGMPSKTTVVITAPERGGRRSLLSVDDIDQSRSFDFDRCYWSHNKQHSLYSTQETLQAELGEQLLSHAMEGFNNCIFAYGQTGSGKSYSVLGGKGDDRGLLPRIVEGLFKHFSEVSAGTTCKTLVSFIEIYNENIRDLLANKDQEPVKLEIKQHPMLGIFIPGVTEAAVATCEDVLELVDYGTAMRQVSATAMNAASSRSHCIFTFKTSVSDNTSGKAKHAQTHLVDLAGSERSKRTHATGDRLKEGNAINQSLSTLARVISALAKKKKENPPFRDSKLTFILKESLCGNSKTVMMAAVSPCLADYDETLSTLKFAQSVKQVQTNAVVNTVNEKGLEAAMKEELDKLRGELSQLTDSKSDDRRVISELSKTLQQQEQILRRFSNWESLLAAEKRLHEHRKNIVAGLGIDAEGLERLQRQFEEKQAMKQETGSDTDSDSSSQSSGLNSVDSGSGRSASSRGAQKKRWKTMPLVRDMSGTNSLVISGPVVQTKRRQGIKDLSAAVSAKLGSAKALASETEAFLVQLDANNRVKLKALVTVDFEDAEADVIIQAIMQPADDKDADDSNSLRELLTTNELDVRLRWLQKNRHRTKGDAWAASRQSSSKTEFVDASAVTELKHQLASLQAELQKTKEELVRQEAALSRPPDLVALGELNQAVAGSVCSPSSRAQSLTAAVAASFNHAMCALDEAERMLDYTPPSRLKGS